MIHVLAVLILMLGGTTPPPQPATALPVMVVYQEDAALLVRHVVDDIAVISTGHGYLVLGPYEQVVLESGQTLTTTWVDGEGLTHTVTTKVKSPSQIDLYIKRHDKLVRAYKVFYPPAQQQ